MKMIHGIHIIKDGEGVKVGKSLSEIGSREG